MTGMLFSSVMNLMNAVYLKEWNKWVWLYSVILSKNATAGSLGFVMVVYSFIADNSNDK
jgi:ABC-type sulfate transport system permease subunit